MTDDEFLLAFQTCAFTRPEWTHEAHVRMAWLYLTRFPFAEVLDRIRCGIRKLNAKIGQPAGHASRSDTAALPESRTATRTGTTSRSPSPSPESSPAG